MADNDLDTLDDGDDGDNSSHFLVERKESSLVKYLSLGLGALPVRAFDFWSTGFNVGWEVDLWGKIRRNLESADAEIDAVAGRIVAQVKKATGAELYR